MCNTVDLVKTLMNELETNEEIAKLQKEYTELCERLFVEDLVRRISNCIK